MVEHDTRCITCQTTSLSRLRNQDQSPPRNWRRRPWCFGDCNWPVMGSCHPGRPEFASQLNSMMALASAQILDASSSKFPWCYGDKKKFKKTTAACMAELQYSPLQHGYRSWTASYIVWYSSSWNLAGTQGVYISSGSFNFHHASFCPLWFSMFSQLFYCGSSFQTWRFQRFNTQVLLDVVLPKAFHQCKHLGWSPLPSEKHVWSSNVI